KGCLRRAPTPTWTSSISSISVQRAISLAHIVATHRYRFRERDLDACKIAQRRFLCCPPQPTQRRSRWMPRIEGVRPDWCFQWRRAEDAQNVNHGGVCFNGRWAHLGGLWRVDGLNIPRDSCADIVQLAAMTWIPNANRCRGRPRGFTRCGVPGEN